MCSSHRLLTVAGKLFRFRKVASLKCFAWWLLVALPACAPVPQTVGSATRAADETKIPGSTDRAAEKTPQQTFVAAPTHKELRDGEDWRLVRDLLIQHAGYTGSPVAARLLKEWDDSVTKFVKVMPIDYRRVLDEQKRATPVAQPAQVPLEVTGG